MERKCKLTFFLTGVILYEYEVKLGWGKAVALPAQALPAPPPGQMAVRSKEVSNISLNYMIYSSLQNEEYREG